MTGRVPWILADDLSGALEAGAAWRAKGWRVVLSFEGDAFPSLERTAWLCSTESRNLSPARAYEAAGRALARCAASGGKLAYKKIDSTLRGPIAAEARAVVQTMNPRLVVLTPANPALGRTMEDGELRVGGVRIAESAFARDPVWPVTEGRVANLLKEFNVEGVAEVRAASRVGVAALEESMVQARRDGFRVLVADAVQPQDLEALVAVARRVEPGTIFVGSGALAPILADPCVPVTPLPVGPAPGGTVYFMGTRHEVARQQISRLVAAKGMRVIPLLPGEPEYAGAEIVRRLANESAVVLAMDSGAQASPAAVNRAFAEAARFAASRGVVRTAFVTGGETALAVCRAMDVQDLEVAAQIEPGVVRTVARARGGAMTVVVKPGGFGSADTLLNVAAALES